MQGQKREDEEQRVDANPIAKEEKGLQMPWNGQEVGYPFPLQPIF